MLTEILIDMKFIEYFNNNNLKIQPLCFDLAKNQMVNFYDYIEDRSLIQIRKYFM